MFQGSSENVVTFSTQHFRGKSLRNKTFISVEKQFKINKLLLLI